MLNSKFVSVLLLSVVLCFQSTNGQFGNWFGCFKRVICDIQPYIEKCCLESFQDETENSSNFDKKVMLTCLYNDLCKEALTCISNPATETGGGGEVEGEMYDTGIDRNERFTSEFGREDSATQGFKKSIISNQRSSGQNKFNKHGFSGFMQNEDCEFIKNNQPEIRENCSDWSEAASRCVNSMLSICQREYPPFGNFGGGTFWMTGQGSFQGIGNKDFGFNGQGSFGGIGDSGFGFNNQHPFGGFGSTDFGSTGNHWFSGISKPMFPKGKWNKAKFPPPPQSGEREWEEVS